jgi:tRNA (cytidine/uridine-2'-O-)-methyltransferase
MFHIVLVHPEIPPNTGNVIRLAANTGSRLHLVEPLGFTMDDRQLKRAGLDYHDLSDIEVHKDWPACMSALGKRRLFALTTRGTRSYAKTEFRVGDAFVFGPETRGLDGGMLEEFPASMRLRLPMLAGNRSLNLSNAVAVVVFEAWRQIGFLGAAVP